MKLMDLLIILPAFLLTIGILVTVHEFGHFWVARRLGVKVLRFSVGFGKPLWKRVSPRDQTEYVIAALPLGGYVKMLDEREGTVPPSERHLAFNTQPVWKRIAIVAAGPLANFILAIIIYALVFMTGNPAMQPLVEARSNSPAAVAGIQPGDRVLKVNDYTIASWDEARMVMLEEYLKQPVLTLTVKTQQDETTERRLDLSGVSLLKEDQGDFLRKSGLTFWAPEKLVVLGDALPDSPAAKAGLQPLDIVVAMDGKPIKDVDAFIAYIQERPEQSIDFQIKRESGIESVSITPAAKQIEGKTVGQIGAGVGEGVPPEVLRELEFTQYQGPVEALASGVKKTWQTSVLTLKLMGRMITGEVSLKNISGPITIAKFSGETALAGLPYYLSFLAIVSISLGVLNLLPIPMLDGGHLLYYLIEIVKGSPVSEKFEEFGLRFGMAVVASVMVLALYNDFMRLLN